MCSTPNVGWAALSRNQRQNWRVWPALALGSGLLLGCGDSPTISVAPFAQPRVPLVVQQVFNLTVGLTAPARERTVVSIDNPVPQSVEFSPAEVVFRPNEQLQVVEVKGLASTAGFVDVTFSIGESGRVQLWQVRVDDDS